MDFILNIETLLTALVSAAVTWGGTFLFYKQEKKSRDIDNESKQSEEWRKLYLESQEDSRKKDEKIDDLYKIIEGMRRDITALERRVQLNTIYRCDRIECGKRLHSQDMNNVPVAPAHIGEFNTEIQATD